jgi:arabinose-5-phosphate isomerase
LVALKIVKMTDPQQWLADARAAMEIEAGAVLAAALRLDDGLSRAVSLILSAGPNSKAVVTGMGKSGHIAAKIAATLRSIGITSVFLHPTEAVHGDLGLCQQGDVVVMISKSGSTAELLDLVGLMRSMGLHMIGILGNVRSPLAREMDVVLDASIQKEADPHGFTPTASALVALSMGHALAVGLMTARGFSADQFHRYHPSGQLGHNLRMRVRDVMHSDREVAWVAAEDTLKHVVIEMSERPLGAACVLAPEKRLLGLVTDGDVRRALRAHDDIRTLCAQDVMTKSPTTVGPDALVHDALRLMEDRPSQISVLPVVEASTQECLGLIRVHDIYHKAEE